MLKDHKFARRDHTTTKVTIQHIKHAKRRMKEFLYNFHFFKLYFCSSIVTRNNFECHDVINHYVIVIISTIFVITDSDVIFAKRDVVLCICINDANDDIKL